MQQRKRPRLPGRNNAAATSANLSQADDVQKQRRLCAEPDQESNGAQDRRSDGVDHRMRDPAPEIQRAGQRRQWRADPERMDGERQRR